MRLLGELLRLAHPVGVEDDLRVLDRVLDERDGSLDAKHLRHDVPAGRQVRVTAELGGVADPEQEARQHGAVQGREQGDTRRPERSLARRPPDQDDNRPL